jgi:hypothetical protein
MAVEFYQNGRVTGVCTKCGYGWGEPTDAEMAALADETRTAT